MANVSAIQKLVQSKYQLAAIETNDSSRIKELLLEFSIKMGGALYYWSVNNGLYRLGMNHILIPRTETAIKAINYISNSNHFGIYLFEDYQEYFNKENINIMLLKVAAKDDNIRRLIVFAGKELTIPQLLTPIMLRVKHGVQVQKSLSLNTNQRYAK